MWKGFSSALTEYRNIIIKEWINRGYNNNMLILLVNDNIIYPHWLGNKNFHSSHKSNLLRKDFYGKIFLWIQIRKR